MAGVILGLVAVFFITPNQVFEVQAQETNQVTIHLFWSQGCPHCADEKEYLEYFLPDHPEVELKQYEIRYNRANWELLQKVGKAMGADVSGVPFTLIGDQYFTGWLDGPTHGPILEKAILICQNSTVCPDIIDQILSPVTEPAPSPKRDESIAIPESITVPIIGNVNIKNLSLPVITIVFAAIDGFNPCAMWVLLFLISLLLGFHDRKKMWLFGIVFLMASSFIYFLFMSAWLNLLLLVGLVIWVRIIIGGLAIVAGGYHLKEFSKNKDGCAVTGDEKRQKIFQSLRQFVMEKKLLVALLGIIVLAFAVNLIELICSAGLPAVYAQILAINDLAGWQYYAYLLFYVFIFMLDDLIVFTAAMITLKMVGITTRYQKFAYLVGGLLMIIIGLLLLFKPEYLMFG
ncbi:MAG: hypothetical protein V1853_02295 [bacterium]